MPDVARVVSRRRTRRTGVLLVLALVSIPGGGRAAPGGGLGGSPNATGGGAGTPVDPSGDLPSPVLEPGIVPGPNEPGDDALCLFAPRRLQEIGSAASTAFFTPPPGVWTQTAWHIEREIGSLEALRWKGDARSFIDVFDQPIFSGTAGEGSEGASYGNVLRLRYPYGESSCEHVHFDLDELGRAIDTPLAWADARAFRHYDRGRCSVATSWREFLDQFAQGLEDGIDQRIRDSGGRLGKARVKRWAPLDALLTPHLVMPFRGDRDFFRYTHGLMFKVKSGGNDVRLRIFVRFDGQFFVDAGALRFRFRGFDVDVDVGIGLDEVVRELGRRLIIFLWAFPPADPEELLRERFRGELEAGINRMLAQRSGQVIENPFTGDPLLPCTPDAEGDAACLAAGRDVIALRYPEAAAALEPHNLRCRADAFPDGGGACAFFPTIRRFFQKPDGFEVVLVEDESDPLFTLLASERPQVCERVAPARPGDAVTGGYFAQLRFPLREGVDAPTVGEGGRL